MNTIVFCTAIKNRLHHLKETLTANILQNKNYSNAQFLILDYNSTDGLDRWIKQEMGHHIISEKLVYYRTEEPQFFHRSHSRNMAFRLATGDLICNIDADNFTGTNFAGFLDEQFTAEKIFVASNKLSQSDFLGRICCKKSDFEAINGYDERMEGYGFEDMDFQGRLEQFGLKKIAIDDNSFLTGISHGNLERIADEKLFHSLESVFLSHVTPSKTDLLFLFTNGIINAGRLINCRTVNSGKYASALKTNTFEFFTELSTPYWIEGVWLKSGSALQVRFKEDKILERIYSNSGNGVLVSGRKKYQQVIDKEVITDLLILNSQLKNRYLMQANRINKGINASSFGNGIVFKNFGDQPIQLN